MVIFSSYSFKKQSKGPQFQFEKNITYRITFYSRFAEKSVKERDDFGKVSESDSGKSSLELGRVDDDDVSFTYIGSPDDDTILKSHQNDQVC